MVTPKFYTVLADNFNYIAHFSRSNPANLQLLDEVEFNTLTHNGRICAVGCRKIRSCSDPKLLKFIIELADVPVVKQVNQAELIRLFSVNAKFEVLHALPNQCFAILLE